MEPSVIYILQRRIWESSDALCRLKMTLKQCNLILLEPEPETKAERQHDTEDA